MELSPTGGPGPDRNPWSAPPPPTTPPPANPPPLARHTTATPPSQLLVAAAVVVVFTSLALRFDAPLAVLEPTAALVAGIAIGLAVDVRRLFTSVSGIVAALVCFALLSFGWVLLYSQDGTELPYELVPLAAVVVLGLDWRWVERLRPVAVLSGLGLVPLLEQEVLPALALVLVWFGLTAAALWSLRRDAFDALPAPLPLAPAAPATATGASSTVLTTLAAWGVAALLVGLIGALAFSPPTPDPSDAPIGRDDPMGGGGLGSGGLGGGGSTDTDGDGIPDIGADIDGDGVPERDRNGDGVPDDWAGDGQGPERVGSDRDGDGIEDRYDTDVGDGYEAGEGDGSTPGGGPSADGDGTSAGPTGTDGSDTSLGRTIGRILGVALLVALVAAIAWWVHRERTRRRALAARPWPITVSERLEREGARRGRRRRRDEPVTSYAAALGHGVLPDDRLGAVGAAVSAALFGPGEPAVADGAWATTVIDEAVEANPVPRALDRLRRGRGAPPTPGSAA